MKTIILSILFISLGLPIFGQNETVISIPEFNDEYSKTVKLLESGETDIDYKNFRKSFLESKQFKVALKQSSELRDLKKLIYKLMSKNSYDSIIDTTKKMLSINYTNLTAQKILRQTYGIIGDSINAKKYKTIQFGLMMSIVESGDGKTCETAWEVIQISEEYFILEMIGAKLNRQTLDTDGGICDKMEVTMENDALRTYYFEVSSLLIAKQNLNNN